MILVKWFSEDLHEICSKWNQTIMNISMVCIFIAFYCQQILFIRLIILIIVLVTFVQMIKERLFDALIEMVIFIIYCPTYKSIVIGFIGSSKR